MLTDYIQGYGLGSIKGYIIAMIVERMTTARVSETELDSVKNVAEKCRENEINHSDFSDEEKDDMKKRYKLWAESALQGMKKRLRESGRFV